MDELGVLFDSKITWASQINQIISKVKIALHAICLIKPYFAAIELKQIITANFNSILYYNSNIWHLPTLALKLKQKLLSASGMP